MSSIEQRIRETIDIPKYFEEHINPKIDLRVEHKILCPFHDDSDPSFTYSESKGLWRCWSTCNTGGDVIKLHQTHKKLRKRSDAIKDLARRLNIKEVIADFKPREVTVNLNKLKFKKLLNIAESTCKGTDDYIELDYIMSIHQSLLETIDDLTKFIEIRGGNIFESRYSRKS